MYAQQIFIVQLRACRGMAPNRQTNYGGRGKGAPKPLSPPCLPCAKRFANVVGSSPRQPVSQIKSIFPDYNSGSKQRSSTHQTAYKAESAGVTGTPCPMLFLLRPLSSKVRLRHRGPHGTESAAAPQRHAPRHIRCWATRAMPRPCALVRPYTPPPR